jgi:hypothetical protein
MLKQLIVALIASAFALGAYAQAPKSETAPADTTKAEKKAEKKAKSEKKAKAEKKSKAKSDKMDAKKEKTNGK